MRLLIISALFTSLLSAQSNGMMTGSLNYDFNRSFEAVELVADNDNSMTPGSSRKSPMLAAAMSLAIPGAGEFYTENYFKSGIFVAVEIAAITLGLIYDGKGDDQTVKFEAFAEAHWSVERYAEWAVNNAARINPNLDIAKLDIYDNHGNVVWSKLNDLEREIGSWFSHQLAPYQDQQYYEMIGKYQQFNAGWDDFSEPAGNPFDYGDKLTDRFNYYSGERGKANEYYDIAGGMVLVIVVNHVLSAADAALSAKWYNEKMNLNMSLHKENIGYASLYYPKLNVSYAF